jgi:predicted RNase H-like HicB family nuclease
MKMTLNVIVERDEDGDIFARMKGSGFLLTTVGKNMDEIEFNLKDLLQDYLENEGKENLDWKGLNINDITFEYEYDLSVFFESFDMLKISSVAGKAGINASLMRQYASGVKHPSRQQVTKIEQTIHGLGESLRQVRLF